MKKRMKRKRNKGKKGNINVQRKKERKKDGYKWKKERNKIKELKNE